MYNTRNSNASLTSSSDIVGEVTLKTSVDGYQPLKVNEMIKNAVTWRMQKRVSFQNILITALRKVPQVCQNPRYTLMKQPSKLWAKLPRTSGTRNRSLSRLWKCTSTSATRTWRMSPSPTHKTDYQSNTDLMATTKMYIAQTLCRYLHHSSRTSNRYCLPNK